MRHLVNRSFFALALLAAAAGRAPGEEVAPTPAETLVAEIDAAKTAKDTARWSDAVKRVSTVWEGSTEAERKNLWQRLSAAIKSKEAAVRDAALATAVETKDADGAWKAVLKAALPDAKTEEADEFSIRAVDAVKTLHPDGAVQTLLGLLDKTKDPKVFAATFRALGGYERSKHRVQILPVLIETVKRTMPGQSTQKASAPTPRWIAVEGSIIPTLNELTGQNHKDLATWFQLWDENKKRPAALFDRELEQ